MYVFNFSWGISSLALGFKLKRLYHYLSYLFITGDLVSSALRSEVMLHFELVNNQRHTKLPGQAVNSKEFYIPRMSIMSSTCHIEKLDLKSFPTF